MEAEQTAHHRNDAIKLYVGRLSEIHADASLSVDGPDAPPDWTWARCHASADSSPAHRVDF